MAVRSGPSPGITTDFGAGRALGECSGEPGRDELAGTPLYLAPEVLAGAPASAASEIYSLGVLLYHLATGSFPVRCRTLRELREAHARGERVGMKAYGDRVPRALAATIDRAIDPDPAARFGSVEALGAALLRASTSTTSPRAGRRPYRAARDSGPVAGRPMAAASPACASASTASR